MAGPVCCGLIPHLELALHPELYGRPVVVASLGDRIIAASWEAASHGVLPGMTLRQAEALSPAVAVMEPQPEAARRLRERIAAALYDLAPVVEVRLDGRAWLDLEGPRTGQALKETRRRLRDAGYVEPRLGVAPGPFTAALVAARSRPGRLLMVAEARSFLAPLPVEELPLEAEQLERLDLLGLRTLGQVAAIGPRRLESQLGKAGREAVLLARGDEPRPLTPWRPPKVVGATRQMESPVEDREALLFFVARGLIDDLAAELGLRGAGAKRVRMVLHVDGVAEPERRESLVRHSLSSSAELFGLVGSWLREWQPAAAVTEVAIELPELEAAGRRQLRLWRGGDGSVEEVAAALERLQKRYGEEVALTVRSELLASPLPAQRYALVPK